MREKTRQNMIAAGTAMTIKNAVKAIASACFQSWSGCMSGNDWCGTRIFRGREEIGNGTHQQNNAPTGWERRGKHAIRRSPTINRGDVITITHRFAFGRNPAGDTMYRTDRKVIKVV